MREQTWMFLDRSEWGRGPWDSELMDKIQWTDAATQLPCLAVRNSMGNWCGYVGVSPQHPWYGVGYNACDGVDVHGGLTYSDVCSEEEMGICHIPSPGEEEQVWWFGFDTAHADDLSPSLRFCFTGGIYRDLAYVKAECLSLAKQLEEYK